MIDRIATVKKTSELLQTNTLNPKSRYGQNFMVSPKIPSLISEQSEITKDSLVIEIGPGLGALTQYLLEKSKKVICYEIDTALSTLLKETLKDYTNLEVYNEDILKVDLESIDYSDFSNIVVVSNLPYYITSDILIKLLKSNTPFTIIAMMQKEVASRIKQAKDINELVLYAHLFSDVSKVTEVSKNDFFPKPNVDSTVLKFTKKDVNDKDAIASIINMLYVQRRKTINHNLKHIDNTIALSDVIINKIYEKSKINNLTRIDDLSLNQIKLLIDTIKEYTYIKCPSKINLGLKINSKKDNYHYLSSVFLPIDLYDYMHIYITDNPTIKIESNLIDPSLESFIRNLIKDYGCVIKITKNIPILAGLGGSSSDYSFIANYFLKVLDLNKENVSTVLLQKGVDTIYFNDPKIKYLDNSLDNYKDLSLNIDFHILLIKPNDGLSTKDVFNEYDKLSVINTKEYEVYKYINDYDKLIKSIFNDLESPAFNLLPKLKKLKVKLEKYHVDYVGMSGSGSCLYVLSKDIKILKNIENDFDKNEYFIKLVRIIK